MIVHIVKSPSYSELSTRLQQEVFEFGSNSALSSGLFDTLTEARQFAREIINDAFMYEPEKQYCFEIYSNNNILGYAWLRDKHCLESPGEIRLSYIRIDPAYRRKGIANQAILLLEEYAIKAGFTEMSLNVFANVSHTKKLYERIGFKVTQETERSGKIVTTEMRKTLKITA